MPSTLLILISLALSIACAATAKSFLDACKGSRFRAAVYLKGAAGL